MASANTNSNSMYDQPAQLENFHLGMFNIEQHLGEDKFGNVYLAQERNSGLNYALKILNKEDLERGKLETQVQRQIDVHSSLRHQNILKFYGHFHDAARIYLVLEFVGEENLYQHLRRENRFPEWKAARYIAQVAAALEYIHGEHVMHRDIKPENIFLDIHGDIKISDFSWSVRAPSPYNRRNTLCGTLDYLSPEMLKSPSQEAYYTNKVDLWSLGVLLYEFLAGEAPFEDTPLMTQRRIANVEMTIPSSVSLEARDLIKRLLVLHPDERISIEGVQKHPWIIKHSAGKNLSTEDRSVLEGP